MDVHNPFHKICLIRYVKSNDMIVVFGWLNLDKQQQTIFGLNFD
jgi:hypothetical protein